MKAVLGGARRMLGFVFVVLVALVLPLVLPLVLALVLRVGGGVGVAVRMGMVFPGRRLVISVTSFVLMLVLDILGCIGGQGAVG
jgi:hypothetical protein